MIKLEKLIEITEANCINHGAKNDLSEIEVNKIAALPELAEADELALIFSAKASKAAKMLEKCSANIILLAKVVEEHAFISKYIEANPDKIYIFVNRPKYALKQILPSFYEEKEYPGQTRAHKQPNGAFVHPSAVIDPSAKLAEGVVVGPFTCIGANAVIGANTKLHSRISIGANAKLGSDCEIAAGVVIEDSVQIGDRVIIAANSVIGSDGYSFSTKEASNLEKLQSGDFTFNMDRQVQEKIVSAGTVVIGDDVEIGSNTSIDKGSIGDTVIGDGTKIDNLCQIAHNVKIGKDCLIIAQVGIAGSAQIGDRATLAGSAGVGDGVKIGNDSVLAAFSAANSEVDPFLPVMGAPAVPHGEFLGRMKAMIRLPKMQKEFKELKAKVEKLTEREAV